MVGLSLYEPKLLSWLTNSHSNSVELTEQPWAKHPLIYLLWWFPKQVMIITHKTDYKHYIKII